MSGERKIGWMSETQLDALAWLIDQAFDAIQYFEFDDEESRLGAINRCRSAATLPFFAGDADRWNDLADKFEYEPDEDEGEKV